MNRIDRRWRHLKIQRGQARTYKGGLCVLKTSQEEFSLLMGKCAIHNSLRIRKSEIGAGASPAPTISSAIVGATLAVAHNAVSPDRRVTVGDIVGAYKSLVANACLKIYKSNHQTTGKFWQRNFGKIGKPYRENFIFHGKKCHSQFLADQEV